MPPDETRLRGRLADAPVDGQLVRIVGRLQPLECPPEDRLGLGEQGERLLHHAATTLLARQEQHAFGDGLIAAAHIVEQG